MSLGGMPRRTLVYSALFHIGVAAGLWGLYHFHFFDRDIVDDTPLVVKLVNPSELTRATELNLTPPQPEKKEVAQAEPPKPEPPKAEPPKPEPAPPPPPPPPPPQPPKPEPPKPAPPPPSKPEPPKPAPAPPPPKPELPKKKEEDVDTFVNSILKNVQRTHPTQQEPEKQVAKAEPKASPQPMRAPLGAQLSTSELDLVKQQLNDCWYIPAGAKDAQDLRPQFRVYMNPDATVRSAVQLNSERNSDPFFRAAAESAMRALHNPRCSPLKLPLDKYAEWQTFTITFDPKDVQ